MALVMVAAMLALGTWQVQRLEWKTALIERVESRMAAKPVPLPEKLADPAAWEFRRVTMAGHFLFDREILVGPRTHEGKPGQHMYVPFRRASGGTVFVNRGWIPSDAKKEAFRPAGIVQVEGIVRLPERNMFTPENDATGGAWYWPDIPAMAQNAKLQDAATVIVEAAGGKAGVYPLAETRAANIRNDHRQYAIFWFGMAFVMMAVYILASLGPQDKLEEKNASL